MPVAGVGKNRNMSRHAARELALMMHSLHFQHSTERSVYSSINVIDTQSTSVLPFTLTSFLSGDGT